MGLEEADALGCRDDMELEAEEAEEAPIFIHGWLSTWSMVGRSWGLNESIHLISDWASVMQKQQKMVQDCQSRQTLLL